MMTQAVTLSLEGLKPSDIPSPPQSCLRIIEAASEDGFNFDNFTQHIAADPAFTSEVLRTVNSPYFAPQEPITTVRRAIFMLGWRQIRNLALSFAVRESLRDSPIPQVLLQQFWSQAVLRATACRQLSQLQSRGDAEEAFTVGLLQDVGFLVLMHLRPMHLAEWPELLEMAPAERLVAERERFGATHVDVVRVLAERWGLPEVIHQAIARHHDDGVDRPAPSDLAGLAHAADLACAVYAGRDKAKALDAFEACLLARGLPASSTQGVLEQISLRAEGSAAALGFGALQVPTYEQILHAANQTLMLIKDREEERSYQLQALLQKKEEMARQLEHKMSQLKELVYVDPLTGLANRRRFDSALLELIAAAARDKQPLTLIVMDIDHFKRVNDTFGHPIGDEALRRVADVIVKCTRSTDHRARIGGEEMAIALLGANPEIGQRIAEKIRTGVENIALSHAGRMVPLSMSLGGTTFEKTKDPELVGATAEFIAGRMMQIADAALYAAKQAGRNRVHWGTSSQPAAGR